MEIINVPGRYAIKLYVEKESGNLHVRNIDMGVHMPLMYAVYSADREPLCLRDYMNIREIRLIEAVKELEASNAVLLGNSFNIGFSVKKILISLKRYYAHQLLLRSSYWKRLWLRYSDIKSYWEVLGYEV